jgi:excisionase family DNA binding protein
MDKLYTCNEISLKYGVKARTVWSWIRSKKLPAIKIGNGYRIREEDLKIFEESRKTIL